MLIRETRDFLSFRPEMMTHDAAYAQLLSLSCAQRAAMMVSRMRIRVLGSERRIFRHNLLRQVDKLCGLRYGSTFEYVGTIPSDCPSQTGRQYIAGARPG